MASKLIPSDFIDNDDLLIKKDTKKTVEFVDEKRKNFSFTLKPSICKKASICAKKNNITLSRLIENFLISYIKDND